jgi:hypothetical protein
MAQGSTQPITEMSTRDFSGSKGRPARKAIILTAICWLIVKELWEFLCLTTLWASTSCYRDGFTFFVFDFKTANDSYTLSKKQENIKL